MTLSARTLSEASPTLPTDCRDDRAFHSGLGRDVAAGIPKSRFMLLDGGGHVPWYGECEPALRSIAEFLGDDVADTLRPLEGSASLAAGTSVAVPPARDVRPSADDGYQVVHRDLLLEHRQVQLDRCRVALGQLFLPLDFFEATTYGLLALRPARLDEMRRKLAAMVKVARNEHVDLLLLPELAVDLKSDALREDLRELAAETGLTIVPGSYHDVAGRRNVAAVVGPEGILWEQEKQLPAILHVDGNK